jgi:molybdenum cofactor cytidylyltransferase
MGALGAVVLAAGASERFGADNKLLVNIAGELLIRRVVQEIIGSGIAEVVIVTGYDEARIAAALEGLAIRRAHNRGLAIGHGHVGCRRHCGTMWLRSSRTDRTRGCCVI